MFSGSNSICQASVEDTNEFPGTDLLLEDNFESEIVTRRFQEGGLSFTSAASDSFREGFSAFIIFRSHVLKFYAQHIDNYSIYLTVSMNGLLSQSLEFEHTC